MRRRLTQPLDLIRAVNCVTLLGEEHGVRHRGVVPLLAVPHFVHGTRGVGSRGINNLASPSTLANHIAQRHPQTPSFSALFVDIDENDGRCDFCRGRLGWRAFLADMGVVVPPHARALAIDPGQGLSGRLRRLRFGRRARRFNRSRASIGVLIPNQCGLFAIGSRQGLICVPTAGQGSTNNQQR